MWSLQGFRHGIIKWIMFQSHLDYFQTPPLGAIWANQPEPTMPPRNECTGCFDATLLELGPTRNRETVSLRNLTTDVFSFQFMMCEDPAWIEIHWNSSWLMGRLHMTSHYTWGPWFWEVSWDQCLCLTNFIWRSTSNPKCLVTLLRTKMSVNWHLHFIPNVTSILAYTIL